MSDAGPPWAYERPELHPHDSRWSERAQAERARLLELLAPWLAAGVEHVGSTAVAGLAAKPVIDLMASVSDPDAAAAGAGPRLAGDGWCYVPPHLDRRSWRRFFVKADPSGQRRVAHLHLIPAGHPRWAEQIAFRDALREDRQLARRYEDLKRQLSAQHAADREAYSAAKASFVAEVLSRGQRRPA